jgi:hypothetical protein
MAHYAKIDENNIVIDVNVIDNDMEESMGEEGIIAWLLEGWGGHNWIKTSYNGTIRKNFAGIGYTYDLEDDVFIPSRPWESWVLNKDIYRWEPPINKPDNTHVYIWNEETVSWDLYLSESEKRMSHTNV